MRWALPFALLGVAGCSKVGPTQVGGSLGVGEFSQAPAASAGGVLIQNPEDRAKALRMQAFCSQLVASYDKVPRRLSAEYPKLQELLRSMSPLIQSDSRILVEAHKKALRNANERVVNYLAERGAERVSKDFHDGVKYQVRYNRLGENGDEDLRTVLQKILFAEEGTPCATYYLDIFYTEYVKNVDLFGTIMFGSNSNPAQADTLGLSVQVPREIASADVVQDLASGAGRALWVTLLNWEGGPSIDRALLALENRYKDTNGRGIILDLRYSGGRGTGVLARIRQSAAKGWGRLPIVLITSQETRGVAAVLASELAQRPNVQVWGTAPEIYGYGRKLKQQALTLAPELSEASVVVGSELLSPSDAPNSDGHRLRLRDENVLERIDVDEMIGRADRFAQTEINEAPAETSQNPSLMMDLQAQPQDAGALSSQASQASDNGQAQEPIPAVMQDGAPQEEGGAQQPLAPQQEQSPPPSEEPLTSDPLAAGSSSEEQPRVPASVEVPPTLAVPADVTLNATMPRGF